MSQEKPVTIDFTVGAICSSIIPCEPILSSRQAGWEGILVEHHRQPAHETPTHFSQQHIIGLHIGQPMWVERYQTRHLEREHLVRGDIAIYPAFIEQAIRWENESEYILLAFEPFSVTSATDELINAESVEIKPQLKLCDPLIREIALALWHELTADGVGSRLYVESLFATLCVHLIRHHCTSQPKISTASGGLSQTKLRRVIEYINDNLEQNLSLRAIAQTVQMSPYHFARRFKLSTGLTPHQYVLHCRLERAKRLLADTKMAITDIAYRTGFSSPSHLTRVFRQHIATTPKAYREAL